MPEREKQSSNTFVLKTWKEVSILAGGGFSGFGGIAVYYDYKVIPSTIGFEMQAQNQAFGYVFDYNDVARIKFDDALVWINRILPDAPSERQDVRLTGIVEIEFFDNKKTKKIFKHNFTNFRILGFELNSSDELK